MKNIIIAIIVSVISIATYAKEDRLINALIKVESNGNDYAIGDKGNAVGCLQIWKCVIDDVNRFSTTKYVYSDRYNREKSIEICNAYISHYATEKRIGRKVTDEDKARIWNGGPNGYKKESTKGYWKKVKARI